MTQADVAKKANVSVSYVSTIERGQSHSITGSPLRPEPDKVEALANAVGGNRDEALALAGYSTEAPIFQRPSNLTEFLAILEAIGVSVLHYEGLTLDSSPEFLNDLLDDLGYFVELRLTRRPSRLIELNFSPDEDEEQGGHNNSDVRQFPRRRSK